MTCRWVQEQLSAYLDNHLNGRDMATVWKHLQACPSCRAHETQLRQTVQLLKGLACPPAPAGFWTETYRRLRESARTRPPQPLLPWYHWRSLVLPAVAAALVAIVLWNVWPVGGGNPTDDAKLRIAEHAASSAIQPAADRARLVGMGAR